jgi:hypothetical protein
VALAAASLVPVLLLLGGLYAFRARDAFSAVTVETANASLTSGGGGSAPAGTPILAASGYLVARRKAVVSAKIQGRLAELRVEEGSRVREGELIARLESSDYEAQVRRGPRPWSGPRPTWPRRAAGPRGPRPHRAEGDGAGLARRRRQPRAHRAGRAGQARADLGLRRPSSRTRASSLPSPASW